MATKIRNEQIIDGVTSYGMARQAIMNGNFDVWQRNTTKVLVDALILFCADRWRDYINKDGGILPTLGRSRQLITAGDIPNAFYYSRINTNGAGTSLGVNSQGSYAQLIENGTRNLCGNGKKVTVSFWARSDIANKRISLTAVQSYGTGGSPSATEFIKNTPITLTSTWTKYTVTFTTNTLVGKTFGTAIDDTLELRFYYVWGTTFGNTYVKTGVSAETFVGAGNIDIAQVQLCAGDVALPFQPKSFEEELRACQRYYEKSFKYTTAPVQNSGEGITQGMTSNAGAVNNMFFCPYKVTKRITVTPTTYNQSGTNANVRNVDASTDGTALSVQNISDVGFSVNTTGATGWTLAQRIGVHWTVDAEL